MTDKILRGTTAERHGPVVVVHYICIPDCMWYRSYKDCIWLNMYLDCENYQMICDSDIGVFSGNWSHVARKGDDFLQFCTKWLAKEDWLLRKCIDDKNVPKEFNWHETVLNLRKAYDDIHNSEDEDSDVDFAFDYVLDVANGYDNKDQFIAALSVAADERGVELPDEWWSCIVEDYTPQQKRFAEICREDIVPKLKELLMENKYD